MNPMMILVMCLRTYVEYQIALQSINVIIQTQNDATPTEEEVALLSATDF